MMMCTSSTAMARSCRVFFLHLLQSATFVLMGTHLVPQLPESKDMGLGILCEFIEDCEYPNLSASILHILGQHGPGSATPSKCVP